MSLELDKDLKMITEDDRIKNVVRLTEERIKKFTMDDLKNVLSSIDEIEAKIMVAAIREHRYDKVSHIIEMATYQKMQNEVQLANRREK